MFLKPSTYSQILSFFFCKIITTHPAPSPKCGHLCKSLNNSKHLLYSILKTLCNTKEVLSLLCWVCWKSLNHWWITITSDYSKDNRVVNSYVLSGWGIYVLINIHLYRYSNIHGLTTFFLFCFYIFQVSDGPWFQYTENKHWYFYSANKLTWQEAKVSDMYIFFATVLTSSEICMGQPSFQ